MSKSFDWRAHIAIHPAADLFPLLPPDELAALAADIKTNGLLQPIVIDSELRLLDGRNRLDALGLLGAIEANPSGRSVRIKGAIAPLRAVRYEGADPVAFVISTNLRRRHLDESQRAMVAAKLANLRLGDNQHSEGLPIGRASELLNVGERTTHRAREVLQHGAPELTAVVERGEVSVSAAADVATLSKSEQAKIVARGEREILLAAKEIRNRRTEQKRAERIERIVEISRGNKALGDEKKYPLILADPPWKFKVYDAESGLDSAADAHYPTMETADIAALEIPAAKHCILFLWSTVPHLPEALQVMASWGFEYKSNFVWVKDRAGLGYRARNQHEHLLVGIRGDIPPPLPAVTPSSVIDAKRREHSRKPDETYELIGRMYPELPKIELFARNSRSGWDAWGNQVPDDDLTISGFLRREATP